MGRVPRKSKRTAAFFTCSRAAHTAQLWVSAAALAHPFPRGPQ
jgi:hypothetical protein